ncbi:putative glycoside hydrolase [Thermococcus gammatolerans]|uniref:Glycosyl hydrolase, putative n=1 Tax=Thermococcus gammatolerans (strain DSM 15229 / JCM 11827 / EJ3) TaxID=593117 RepID=C5A3T6_THEGJ|nr:putative glycoside hydrolase [Thermococcus gammatolerans]ACS32898.1 Glycosyl hydrolase, putative [Thermococcus gammatolerans EJ3]
MARKPLVLALVFLVVMSLVAMPSATFAKVEQKKIDQNVVSGVWMWPSTYKAYYQEALEELGYSNPFDEKVYPTIPEDVKEKALKTAAERLVSELKEAGITDVFIEVKLTLGYVIYPSKVYPERTYPAYPYNTTNILKPLLEEAHRNGIRVHAWMIVHYDKYFFGKTDPIWHVGKASKNWEAYPVPGRVRLSNKEYLKVLENIAKELISMGFDGIHLDYIRYPHMVYSFSPKDLERAEEAGINVTKVTLAVEHTFYNDVPIPGTNKTMGPKDPYYIFKLYVKGDKDIVKWFELRRKDVDSYVGNITQVVHSLKTWNGEKPIVSAALMPDWTRDNILYPEEFQIMHYAQVWSDFVKLGVDWLIPMAYFKDYGEPISWVGVVKGHLVGITGTKSVPLVGVQSYGIPMEKVLEEKDFALSEFPEKAIYLVALPADKPRNDRTANKVIDLLAFINKELYAGDFTGYMITEDLEVKGITAPKGSLILIGERYELENLKKTAARAGINVVPLERLPSVRAIPLMPPKIALLDVGYNYTINDVLKELGFKYDIVSNGSIKQGILNKYDLLILPPGSGTWEAKLLGEEGAEKLAEFLAGGGGLIGVCAGGYAVIKGYNEPTSKVQLVDAELKNWPKWWLGVGIVHVKVTNENNPVVFGFRDGFDAIYWNGPVFKPFDLKNDTPLGIDVEPYVELVKYVSPAEEGAFSYGWGDFNRTFVESVMRDSSAVIYSKYGHGNVVLFGFHPELTSGDLEYAPKSILSSKYNYRLWFNAIYFVSRKGREISLEPAKGVVYFRWWNVKLRLDSPDVTLSISGVRNLHFFGRTKVRLILLKVKNYGNTDAVGVTVTVNVRVKGVRGRKGTLTFHLRTLKKKQSVLIPVLVLSTGKTEVTIDAKVSAKNEPKLNWANNELHKTFEFLS